MLIRHAFARFFATSIVIFSTAIAMTLPGIGLAKIGLNLFRTTSAARVEASHGPGRQSRTQLGRRVRYLNAVREGEDMNSTFAAGTMFASAREDGYNRR